MKKKPMADLRCWYCKISFEIECSMEDVNIVVDHYKHLYSFYDIEGIVHLYNLTSNDNASPYFRIDVFLEKSIESNWHLSATALRNIFLNDFELLRQLHYINDPVFECPFLKNKLTSLI